MKAGFWLVLAFGVIVMLGYAATGFGGSSSGAENSPHG